MSIPSIAHNGRPQNPATARSGQTAPALILHFVCISLGACRASSEADLLIPSHKLCQWLVNVSAVSGAARRDYLSGMGELGSPGRFRYSRLKEAVLERCGYGV